MNKPKLLLVCYIGVEIGIGHLSRLIALAEKHRKDNIVTPEFLIFGEYINKNELNKFKVHQFSKADDFIKSVKYVINLANFDAIIFDLFKKKQIENLNDFLLETKQKKIRLISIDSLTEHCNALDLIWIPSFSFEVSHYSDCLSQVRSGWDTYLIQKRFEHQTWRPGLKILVLTGGSDISNLGQVLPKQLDLMLEKKIEIHWVIGPLSKKPNLPENTRLNWTLHYSPNSLDELILQSNYVISIFGVSFFEVLQYGIPSVVFSPYGNKDIEELELLSKEGVAMVVDSHENAVRGLEKLMKNDKLAESFSKKSLARMSVNGVDKLATKIYSLIGEK